MEQTKNSGISVFQRYLTVWVALCMAAGVLIGKFLPQLPEFLDRFEYAGISVPMAVLIFSFQGKVILEDPLHILLIALPLILQTFFIFCAAYFVCMALKLPHNIAAPAGLIGASNFFELAVAVAAALFGTSSPAALATTVGVLTEVPVMLMLCRFANKTSSRFPS